LESQVKNLKYNIYKVAWYMRGGVQAVDLFNSDVDDISILYKIVEENIETAKKTGQPLI
jgi:hypothetical protein